jgi:hypothetical protein
MQSDKSLPGTLHLEDEEGVQRPIKRLTPNEDHRIVGVHITGDHPWKDQISQLTEQGVAFAARVRTHKSKIKTDVWCATKSMIWASFSYPLHALTLSWEHWNGIMSPVLEVCLPRSGFVGNFPRVVLFGLHKYQGQGLSHPWHTQEIMKLGVLWEAFTKPLLESNVLLTNMELLRLEFGPYAPMTDIPFARMDKATTKSWVKLAWISCQKFGLHIEDSLPKPTLKR